MGFKLLAGVLPLLTCGELALASVELRERTALALWNTAAIEKMTQSACFAMGDIARDAAKRRVEFLAERYDRILKGLKYGDASLGLKPSGKPQKLEELTVLSQILLPPILQIAHRDKHSVVISQVLARTDWTVMRATQYAHWSVEHHLSGVMSRPEINSVLLANHLRMVSQRALKEACLGRFEVNRGRKRVKMRESLAEMKRGLVKLEQDKSHATPSAETSDKIKEIETLWADMSQHATRLSENRDIDGEMIMDLNDALLTHLNGLMRDYLALPDDPRL